MNAWRARVEYNPLALQYEISLVRESHIRGYDDVVTGVDERGTLVVERVQEGQRIDPFLLLPRGALEAIDKDMTEFRPTDGDQHLVEALTESLAHERRRVDNVLDRLLPDPLAGLTAPQNPEH